MKGKRYATAFFITRADFTTCGKNIFPEPNKSPTTFIPAIKLISITSMGFSAAKRASSTSISIKASTPFTKECVILSCTVPLRHSCITASFVLEPSPFTFSAKSNKRSVASSRRSRITSSTCSNKSFGISS